MNPALTSFSASIASAIPPSVPKQIHSTFETGVTLRCLIHEFSVIKKVSLAYSPFSGGEIKLSTASWVLSFSFFAPPPKIAPSPI